MPTVDTKRFNPGPPSRTIMLRQLPAQIDETEIRSEFNVLMVPFKDVRLVKNRDTGLNRGFAFVEFNSVEDAQNWMEQTQVRNLSKDIIKAVNLKNIFFPKHRSSKQTNRIKISSFILISY